MAKFAVVQSGGKQYLVRPDQEIIVQKIVGDEKTVNLEVLAMFDDEKNSIEIGSPLLKDIIKASVIDGVKGDKTRVARFKSKVRYRKVRGFRPQLTKLKIGTI